jgi:Pyruvate/2-oxoacid:ferredoxin oxidoreductase gamma subunit
MVALGCYLAKRNVINMKNIFQTIEKMAPAEKKGLIAINKLALEEGMKLR